jgi:hypothetical protein
VKVRSVNQTTLPEESARCIADLTAQVADLCRRVRLIEAHRVNESRAQQADLTVQVHDHDQNSIEFHTENGFVIVRPWEAKGATCPADGVFRFRVSGSAETEREINVEISDRLRQETALRTRGRIEASSDFWICSAERRLANYLMEQGEFPPANEMKIDALDREDVLLAIRWGKSG